jgi:hypothetical protein
VALERATFADLDEGVEFHRSLFSETGSFEDINEPGANLYVKTGRLQFTVAGSAGPAWEIHALIPVWYDPAALKGCE